MAAASPSGAESLAIGELAQLTQTSPRLLRYYEAQGLLTAARTASGHRRYAPESSTTVRSIRLLLDAGVPTRLICELLECVEDASRLEPCAVPMLTEHLDAYDRRLARLTDMRSALQGLIDSSTAPR